ncbi:MAG: ethanolamine ammonia-lyase subunit EutC [Pseudomonadota bacterium]
MKSSWDFLKSFTHARIALGRVGNALPTKALLDFRLAHSEARDSVWTELDETKVQGWSLQVQSRISNKKEFLLNPEKGRVLSKEAREKLGALSNKSGPCDCLLVLADGLSAEGLHKNGNAFVKEFVQEFQKPGLKLGPIILARYARVALGDEMGLLLKARSVLMLIGERPGLSSAESLSVYFTYEPCSGKTDVNRNCISNIHRQGLSPEGAAKMSVYLLQQALVQRLSGVSLKVEYPSEYQRILPP